MQDNEMPDAETLLETIGLTAEAVAAMNADLDEKKAVTCAGRTCQTHEELDAILADALAMAAQNVPEPEPMHPPVGYVTEPQMQAAIADRLASFRAEFVKEVMDKLPHVIERATKPKLTAKPKVEIKPVQAAPAPQPQRDTPVNAQ